MAQSELLPYEDEGNYKCFKRRKNDGTYVWELWTLDDGTPMSCEAIRKKRVDLQPAIKGLRDYIYGEQ